jgi:hypothetical protein
MEALIASSFRPMRITANRRSLRKRVLPVKIKEAPIERLLLAQSSRSLSSMHERWRRPDAAPSTKGWAKGAMSQSEESTDTGATGDPTNDRTQKTGPMCISRRLLEPCAHGAGLIVAAFSARDILRCVKLTSDGGRDTAAALVCGKPRPYFFIFLVFLATFLVALAVFFAFFAFFAMSSSWGWLA